jgi:ferredoxin
VSEVSSGPALSRRHRFTIAVDRELCFGFGDCVDSAPGVFELDGEDKSVVVDPDGADRDEILTAAANCPVDAIFIVDEETGEQLQP